MLVPFLPGETVWIAFLVPLGARLTGSAADGAAVRIAPVSEPHGDLALLAAEAVESPAGPLAFDARAMDPATTPAALADDHLTFTIDGPDGVASRLAVVFATPALFEAVTGWPAPGPTAAQDAYGGWRLP